MVNTLMKYLCVLTVLFFMQSVVFASQLNDTQNNISTAYNTSFIYSFTVEWTNSTENENITECNFTLVRPDDSLTIYNFTTTPLVSNNSSTFPALCSISFTQDELGPAGDYSFNWSANNSTAEYTETWNFTIGTAANPINLIFNNGTNYTNQNINITYGTLINATGYTVYSNAGTVSLFRDKVNITDTEYDQWVILGANTSNYTYKINTSGNENYTANQTNDTYNVTVNKASPTITLLLDGAASNLTVDTNWTINFTAFSNISYVDIFLNTSLPGWTQQNANTTLYNLTTLTDPEDTYNVTAYTNDNTNYTNDSITYNFTINQTAPTLVSMNPLTVNYSRPEDGNYTINLTIKDGSLNNSFLTFNNTTTYDLTNDYIEIDNNTRVYYKTFSPSDWPIGTYNFSWFVNDSSNESYSSGNLTFEIVRKPVLTLQIVYFNYDLDNLRHSNITCWSSDPNIKNDNFTLNTSTTGEAKVGDYLWSLYKVLAAGTYTINCTFNNASLYENYTGFTALDDTITILDVSDGDGGDGGDGDDEDITSILSSGAFTIIPSETAVTLDTNSTKIITFTLNNTRPFYIWNISITVSGISVDWYELNKTFFDKIKYSNGIEYVAMTLNIPEDAEPATYSIKFQASGKNYDGTTATVQTTVQLTVSGPEEVVEAVIATQETPGNETESLLTGFLNITSQYVPYMVPAVGGGVSVLIFFKRDYITFNLMNLIGARVPKKQIKKDKKTKKLKKISFKNFKYKLSINLQKEMKPKTLEIKEEERVDELEKEIKKDMQELKNIIETEKKIKKSRK